MNAAQPSPQLASAQARKAALAGRWSVVPTLSGATFTVRDKLVTTVHGSMPVVEGVVVVSPDGRCTEVWVDLSAAGIATGNRHRDRDLQRAAFLAAASHPTVRVAAHQATETSTGWTAPARVLARGSEAPVDLRVETVAASDGEIRVRVTGRLDRTPLGIKAPAVIVGRQLDLEADLTFRREPGRR